MRKFLLTAFFVIRILPAFTIEPYQQVRTLYNHLVHINSNWANYITEEGPWAQRVAFADDNSLVTTDLLLVEELLRSRDVSGLSKELQEARARHLDEFHAYILAGRFPVNYDHEERRPCFIDRDGGVCAVGNLLMKSGEKELAYYIASNYEYAYVHEMNVERLAAWQQRSGFTLAELCLIQPSYGWKKPYYSNNPNSFAFTYGINVFSVNTHKKIFSSHPESYKHMYSYSYGVNLFRTFRKSKSMIETGCLFISDQYLHTVEGSFGPAGQYGRILTQLNPQYIGIPLLVGFGDVGSDRRSMVKLGYRADFLQALDRNVIPIGISDPMEVAGYSVSMKNYNKTRHSLLLAFTFDNQLDFGRNRMWIHFEPSFSFQLNADQKDNTILRHRPVVMSLNTGIAYNLPRDPKANQRKIDRQKRREARRIRKQQLEEKKRIEKENKEQQKKN